MQCIGGLESYGRKRRSLRHKAAKSSNSTSVALETNANEELQTKRNYSIIDSYTFLFHKMLGEICEYELLFPNLCCFSFQDTITRIGILQNHEM